MKTVMLLSTITTPESPSEDVRDFNDFKTGNPPYMGMWFRPKISIVVPEPYQAGDTPSEMFAEQHGVRHLLRDFGYQSRQGR